MLKYRLIALTDLPVSTRHERKISHDFEKWLFANGYSVLQMGVYTRIADGKTHALSLAKKAREHAPETGTVRLLTLTEQQFKAAELIAGNEDTQEAAIGAQLDIFL